MLLKLIIVGYIPIALQAQLGLKRQGQSRLFRIGPFVFLQDDAVKFISSKGFDAIRARVAVK